MAAKNEHHQAKMNGDKYYYTGKPCLHGHVAARFTSSKGCTVCQAERNYSQIRTEEAKQYAVEYRKNNKEKISEFRKTWLDRNPGKNRELVARRRAAKLQRTPAWLNDGHLFEIECVHKYAAHLRNIGLNYEVDHVVPLQGKSVSGFHVPWNMQVIHISDNRSKGNKHYV